MILKPNCPFCPANGKVKIIAEVLGAYLIAVASPEGEVIPNCYFIIPTRHVESVLDLPSDWQRMVQELLPFIPDLQISAFNLSFNEGKPAGQRVSHVHMWVILRREPFGSPSHGLGLAALVRKANETKY